MKICFSLEFLYCHVTGLILFRIVKPGVLHYIITIRILVTLHWILIIEKVLYTSAQRSYFTLLCWQGNNNNNSGEITSKKYCLSLEKKCVTWWHTAALCTCLQPCHSQCLQGTSVWKQMFLKNCYNLLSFSVLQKHPGFTFKHFNVV